MPITLNVTVKDAEKKSLTKPFLIYEPLTLNEGDPIVQQCLREVLGEFQGEPEDIILKASLTLK